MIVVLTTRAHRYTHRVLKDAGRFDLRIWSYHRAWRRFGLPRATYLFTDFDRLGFWELELAARLHRRLREAGVRVLNDPARARQRFALLRALHEAGVNGFDVWRVEDAPRPARWPVFLRTESAHQGPLSGLLRDERDVEAAVDGAVSRGTPRRGLLLVEYRATPVRGRVFRKLGMFRVGDAVLPDLIAHDDRWDTKWGALGHAGPEEYAEERAIVETNPYEAPLRRAFEVGEIQYGRADFGLVVGRPEVYEINTNPSIKRHGSHPFPPREETQRRVWERLVRAFEAIDTPDGGRIRFRDEILDRQRLRDLATTIPPWTP